MNILLIGSGAREHSIAKSIINSKTKSNLYCLSNTVNTGIKKLSFDYHLENVTDVDNVVAYATQNSIQMTIIGAEAPLQVGLSDALQEHGIKVVGPTKLHAQLECSKNFTRSLLNEYNIDGNVFFRRFTSMDNVTETLELYKERFVIKSDGLCGGKGVVVWGDHLYSMEQAITHCQNLIDNNLEFIIEEKIDGQEFSLISFSDGKHLLHMPVVQDHKRAFIDDMGPNTGGMGTYSDVNHSLPFLSDDDCKKAQQINESVVKALLDKFKTPYQGILYGGFMATKDGVKVIEYNARFGDPEAINLLSLFKGDFIDLAEAICNGTLNTIKASFENKATVCKYVVPTGYPDAPKQGLPVDISNVPKNVELFIGSVDEKDGQLLTTTSRSIAILGIAESIEQAGDKVQNAIASIKGNVVHRPDIGTKSLINKRIKHMNILRNGVYKER